MSTEDLVSDETLSGLQRERVGRTSKLHATDVVALTRLMAKAQQQMVSWLARGAPVAGWRDDMMAMVALIELQEAIARLRERP